MYLFFSSDAHDLFKKGILHTLSYPMGYCEHFRYEYDLLPETIRINPSILKDQEGLIVYAKGNDTTLNLASRNVEFLPIRKVIIKDYKDERNTGLMHFFLELREFTKVTKEDKIDTNLKPPFKFVTKVENVLASDTVWFNKVDELISFDPSFRDILFFNIRLAVCDRKINTLIYPDYDFNEDTSYFMVKENKKYVLDVALYNTGKNPKTYEEHYLTIDNNTDDLVFSNHSRIAIGTDKDNRVVRFSTKTLKTIKSSGSLVFRSLRRESPVDRVDYEIDIRLNTSKTVTNILIYSALVSFAVIGAFLIAYSIGQIKASNPLPWVAMALAVISSIISSAGLFYFFNKS